MATATKQQDSTEVTINKYLGTLRSSGRRGPKVTKESLERKLERLNARINSPNVSPARKASAIQDRLDIEQHLASFNENEAESANPEELTDEFKKVVAEYSDSHGITWMAWREMGVPAAVLKDAGLPRTRRSR